MPLSYIALRTGCSSDAILLEILPSLPLTSCRRFPSCVDMFVLGKFVETLLEVDLLRHSCVRDREGSVKLEAKIDITRI